MKKIFLLTLIVLSINAQSQNIIELYNLLAKSDFCPVDSRTMLLGMEDYTNNFKNTDAYRIDIITVDTKNGYIKAKDPDNDIELCFWNLSNGEKLLAFTIFGCGPQCYSEWFFYKYNAQNGLSKLNSEDIIPMPLIAKEDFFDYRKMQIENTPEDYSVLENECSFSYKIVLPQKGKNIKIYFEPNLNIPFSEKIRYKSLIKGIELDWEDGYFSKGKWIYG